MNDDASLFETYAQEMETASWQATESYPWSFSDDSNLREDLRIVNALRHIQLPDDELRGARTRVAAVLQRELAVTASQDNTPTEPHPSIRFSTRRRPNGSPRFARAALCAAAVLLLACLAGWQISVAAANALPGSPLYSLKRGEELLALDTAWSNQRRGEVLATIADHRLAEMCAEASQQNNALVRSLAREFDTAMHQLISLTVMMAANHQDTSVVAASLAHELTVEYATLTNALRDGDTTLAQTLTVTTQAERSAILNSHLVLPHGTTGAPSSWPGTPAAPDTGPTVGTPSTTGPKSSPTHTPQAGSGKPVPGHGHSGSGNGHVNSNPRNDD